MNQYFSQTTGVAVLSLVKLLERFSYYGMRTLIVLYAIDEFGLTNSDTLTYYGTFTTAVYLANLPMSIISDLVLKQKKGILIGFIFLVVGYFTLVIPNKIAMFGGMILIVIGVGFVNANMVVLLGRLFEKRDKNRNLGFIAYLSMINIGAFLASLVLGYIGNTFGYEYGFGVAGLSAILSLVFFAICMNQFKLIELDDFSTSHPMEDHHPEVLDYDPNSKYSTTSLPPPIPGYRESENIIGRHTIVFGICVVAILFWQLYEVSSFQIFSHFNTVGSINFLGFSIPIEFIYSAQLIFVLPVSLVIFVLLMLGKLKSSINMIGIGLLALAINLGFTYLSVNSAELMGAVSLIGAFFAIAIAEMFMTAIALSYVTRLNNIRFASTVIGLYFLITGIGIKISSIFQETYEEMNLTILAVAPVLIGLVFILGRKLLLQLSGGMD